MLYLTPWPGPQAMSSIQRSVVPGPTDTQSSPVLMEEDKMVTPVDIWTWMPSVLGLLPAALTFTCWIFTFRHALITTWNI